MWEGEALIIASIAVPGLVVLAIALFVARPLSVALSSIGSSLNFKEASTMLTLIDNRSGVQLAASEGSAKNVDMGALGGFFASGFGMGGGGYSNTALEDEYALYEMN